MRKIIKKRKYISIPILWQNNPHVRGPMQLRPVLFEGQLCMNEVLDSKDKKKNNKANQKSPEEGNHKARIKAETEINAVENSKTLDQINK